MAATMVQAQRCREIAAKPINTTGKTIGHGAIAARAVHQHAVSGFPDHGERQHGDHAAEKQQQPVELLRQSAALERFMVLAISTTAPT